MGELQPQNTFYFSRHLQLLPCAQWPMFHYSSRTAPRVSPRQSAFLLNSSLPHLLLYLLVSFTPPFPFHTRFIYFLVFPSLPILVLYSV